VALAGVGLFIPALFGPATLLLAFYPDGRLAARWWRWPVATAAVSIAVATLSVTLLPEGYADIAPGVQIPVVLPVTLLHVVFYWIATPLLLTATAVIWLGTVIRLVRSRSPERQQLALLACVVMPALIASYSHLPVWVAGASALLVPVAIATGVLRYRLLGVEFVLRRGLVYGVLTATVVAAYLIAATLAGSALDRHPLPAVLAAGVVAVGLTPARDRLQRAVDRLVYGERHDPLRAMTRLGDRVTDATEDDLLPAVLGAVVEAVRARGAQVVAADGRVLAHVGAAVLNGEVTRLRIAGRDVGTLRMATRTGQATYTDVDRRLIAALVPPVAALVRALDLAEALEVERDRVVVATRTERDRIRRDLHDSLGPSLAGIGLGLDGLDDELRAGRLVESATLLGRLRDEAGNAVREVRQLIEGLRPAALDEAGLSAAVHRYAQRVSLAIPVDVCCDGLPALSPELETTAYLIITEALTNVVRHADASRAEVVLTAGQQALTITVSDDGTGLDDAEPGVGLGSMQRRAEQLNGRFSIESSLDGTTIRATIPRETA
jgi:signal transduction histidine kinase